MLWNTNLFSKEKVCKERKSRKKIPSFLKTKLYSIVYTPHTLWIHSCTDGYLSCLLILSVVNSAAITMECKYVVKILFFLIWGTCTEVELLDYMIHIFFSFWGNSILFSTVRLDQFIFPPAMHKCSVFTIRSPSPAVSHPDDNHSNRYRWICFPWWLEMSLMCLLTILITPLKLFFCPF